MKKNNRFLQGSTRKSVGSDKRKLLVPHIAMKFSKDFSVLMRDSSSLNNTNKIEVVTCIIEIVEMASNNEEWEKISKKYKRLRLKYAGVLIDNVSILDFFNNHVVLYKAVGKLKSNFYNEKEFNLLKNTDKQILSNAEFHRLIRMMLNHLNNTLRSLLNHAVSRKSPTLKGNSGKGKNGNGLRDGTNSRYKLYKEKYIHYTEIENMRHGEAERLVCDEFKISNKTFSRAMKKCCD